MQAQTGRMATIRKDGRITVEEYAEAWRRDQLHRTLTENYVERTIRLHVVPMLGHLQLSQVRPSHIRGWVKDRSKDLASSVGDGALDADDHLEHLRRVVAGRPRSNTGTRPGRTGTTRER